MMHAVDPDDDVRCCCRWPHGVAPRTHTHTHARPAFRFSWWWWCCRCCRAFFSTQDHDDETASSSSHEQGSEDERHSLISSPTDAQGGPVEVDEYGNSRGEFSDDSADDDSSTDSDDDNGGTLRQRR